MRITLNAKGKLEKYIEQVSEETGMTNPNVLLQLALAGMEYKEGLSSFAIMAAALEKQEKEKAIQP